MAKNMFWIYEEAMERRVLNRIAGNEDVGFNGLSVPRHLCVYLLLTICRILSSKIDKGYCLRVDSSSSTSATRDLSMKEDRPSARLTKREDNIVIIQHIYRNGRNSESVSDFTSS